MSHKMNPFKGCWRIIWMELWDQEYVDMMGPGHVTVDEKGDGEFCFGVVQGYFRSELGQTYIDSEWQGNDEMDEASGEIYASFEEGELRGSIAFDNGDESEFRAIREEKQERRSYARR